VPEHGLVIANAGDERVADLVAVHARAPIAWYAVDGDDFHGKPPHWLAAPGCVALGGGQSFELFIGGCLAGRGALKLCGRHNLANAVAALAAVCQGYGVAASSALAALRSFDGVARRQELRGQPRGIRVYDDFAHHPTSVRVTLEGLRARHPVGALWAVYEPRSATACRALHQRAYATAFGVADHVVLAPLGRDVAASQALDLARLTADLNAGGVDVVCPGSVDAIVAELSTRLQPGDTVVLLSNGAFGGIVDKLLAAVG
jgi:UDP-N-acetylmuramate: L-alanyl-gamma-D-glutamyl-meso-diaminopimelate ligase